MSLYRSLLALLTAVVLVTPVFADEVTQPAAAQPEATQQVTDTATTTTTTTTATTVQQQTKMDINKATMAELTQVKGITPVRAKAIIAYRHKKGDFKSLDDLKNVKGFKKMNDTQLKAIQEQLTIG